MADPVPVAEPEPDTFTQQVEAADATEDYFDAPTDDLG
jgi:hypothetical protein